jgi:hypothetical protein
MSASEHLSPEQFGMRSAAEEHPYHEHETDFLGYKRVDLSGAKFVSHEPHLYPDMVEHYVKHPYRRPAGHPDPEDIDVPEVTEHQGELHVSAGHHRLAAALQRGQRHMYFNYNRTV